jgi:putative ABC transport system permease protein
MISLQRTLTTGYLGQHPTRTVLIVASIALGVATLVATRALNASLNQAAKSSINPFAAMADLLVSNGQTGVPRALADRLAGAEIPGLAEVRPLVMGRVALIDLNDRSVYVLGVNATGADNGLIKDNNPWGLHVSDDAAAFVKDPTPLLGFLNPLKADRPVLPGKKLADALEQLPNHGRSFRVRSAAGKVQPLLRIGVVSLEGEASVIEDSALFMDIDTAAPLVYPDRPEYVTQLNLKLAPGADREQVRRAVEDYLKAHDEPGTAQTVEANQKMVSDVTAGLELGFDIGGVGALVIGLFLVYNALSVSVEERRHDIGVLRSMGATRFQIAGLFVGEAALLGLAGSLLGLPLGYGLAWLALAPVRQALSDVFMPLGQTGIAADPQLMALAALAGVATAVGAALGPAVRAAEEQPADAVRRAPRIDHPLWAFAQAGVALLLALPGVGCFVFRDRLPGHLGSFGPFVCVLLAALVAMPLLSAGAGRVLQPCFRYVFGLEGRLAADNLVRSPARTGFVVAALAATGGLMVQTAGFIHSSQSALNAWVDDSIAADLYVTAGSSIDKSGFALPMEERVGVAPRDAEGKPVAAEGPPPLDRRPDVEAVLPVRFHYFNYQGEFIYLIATDVNAFRGGDQGRAMARNLGRFPRLAEYDRERHRGTAVVSENFAALHHVGVGDSIAVPGRTARAIKLEVIGTLPDYTWNRGTILVDRKWFSEEFGDWEVDVFDVYLKPGADVAAVKADLERPDGWARRQAVYLATREELHAAINDELQRVYNLAYAQQFVVGLVALMGVVSALFISVLQRRRELGLLRAVGASRRQVLLSVLAEAGLMGVIGAAIGAVVGLTLEWYLLRFMLFDEAGFAFPVRVPWAAGGLVLGASVVLATLVGLWPAWHATRLRIPEAIAYE